MNERDLLILSPYLGSFDAGCPWREAEFAAVSGYIYKQTDIAVPGLVMHLLLDGSVALPFVAPNGRPVGVWMRERGHDYAPFIAHDGSMSAMTISIMARGPILGMISGACTPQAPARYAADGSFSDAGEYLLPHALFAEPDRFIGKNQARVVPVELQSPLAS